MYYAPTPEPLPWMVLDNDPDLSGTQVRARMMGEDIHVGAYPALTPEVVGVIVARLTKWFARPHRDDRFELLCIGPVSSPEEGEGAWGPRLVVGNASADPEDLVAVTIDYLARYA